MANDRTELVVEIAKEFIALLQVTGGGWTKGFFRFKSEDTVYGSNASYIAGDAVFLIGAIKNKHFYERANRISRDLIESFDKTYGVLLLTVDSTFDYEIKFEWSNLDKWEISKIDGGTGVPVGL
jgi:hypothetical protein